jgi:hypothetical protein
MCEGAGHNSSNENLSALPGPTVNGLYRYFITHVQSHKMAHPMYQ